MGYPLKAAAIICAAAVVSFFIAQAVIPEKGATAHKDAAAEPAKEQHTAERTTPLIAPGEEVQVVEINSPVSPREPSPQPNSKAPTPAPAPVLAPIPAPAPAVAKQAQPAVVPIPAPAPAAAKQIPPVVATVPAPPPPAPPPKPPAKTGAMPYKIERAAVATSIKDRVPEGIVSGRMSQDARAAYFYTHVTGSTSDSATIIHRWYYNGKLRQASILPVRSSYWRTYSKCNFKDEAVGQWRVDAVEPVSGKVLESASFVVE